LFKDKDSKGGLSQREMKQKIMAFCEKKVPASVKVGDHSITFMSTLIASDPGEKWLIIDTLIPELGNKYLKESDSIQIVCSENNIVHSFSSTYIEETTYETYPSIKIAYPGSMEVLQRRSYVRVDPSISNPLIISCKVKRRPQLDINLPVRDISEGGLSFNIQTLFDDFKDWIVKCDYIQLMGVNPGGQGRPFIMQTLDKIGDFKKREVATLVLVYEKVDDILKTILKDGVEKAMNQFN